MQTSYILQTSLVIYLDISNIDEFITHAHFMLDNEGATIPHYLEKYGETASNENRRLSLSGN